jgi:phosphate transport system substrate-binding protein
VSRHVLAWTTVILVCASGCDLLSSDAPATRPARAVPVHGGGSSFVNLVMQDWCKAYQEAKGAPVYYQSCGSGAGITHMTLQTFDFGCTDAPMTDEQLKKARELGGEVIHVPVCMGAVVLAYNLPDMEQPIRFTPQVAADIFLGKIKKWDDKALKEANPGVELPDQNITVVVREDSSGTTFVWTDYLSNVSPAWAKNVGNKTSVKWPVGVPQKGNEGVSKHIAENKGALGYTELTYALQAKLKTGLLQNRDGYYIRPDLGSVTAAAVAAVEKLPADLRYSLVNPPGTQSYPVSGTVWAVLYVDQPVGRGQAVVDYLRWVIHDGQQFCESKHYARLPPGLVELCDQKLNQVRVNR